MKIRLYLVMFIGLFCLLSSACSPNKEYYKPNNLKATTVCSKCGMIIANYAGPHVQIVWKDGKHSFYCDLFEIMPDIMNKAERERIGAIYVQKGFPKKGTLNGWINATKAIYVVDSKKLGSMGVSYVPFEDINKAKKFKNIYGGQILHYSQINQKVLDKTRKLMIDKPEEYSPHFGPGLL